MDLLELKQKCLVLCHALKQIKHNGSQAPQQCLDILSQAESIEIKLEEAHPWPPSLLLLRRLLQTKQGLFKDHNFKSRLLALIQRWDRLQVAAVGYSWSSRFPSTVAPNPSLPPEVLLKILWSHVADTHKTLHQQWGEQTDFALNCALVSKAWNAAATNLLYRGVIRLFEVSSAKKLFRTLADDRSHPRVISHLVLTPHYLEEATFPEVVSSLLRHCPSIQRLQIAASDLLRMPSIHSSFENLRELQLQGVSLKEFAPMLVKLANLSILAAAEVQNGRPSAFKSGTEPPGDSLAEIPAPTYRLAELHLKGMLLTPEQVRWIIGASETLDLVSLHGIYAPSLPRIIGPLVKTLRLTPGDSPVGKKHTHLAAMIPMFSALTSLHLCGEDWLLEAPLLRTINAPLTELVISWSPSGFENLFAALKDTRWQPQIVEICVDPEAQDNLDLITAHSASQKLREVCAGRNVTLSWFSRTEFAGSFAPTE
ncbi:hypothetical protein C8R45DRAFT_959990 [Mycena sanguinolenta]|nr:hypothetical protein C8R45DRAFT_959990 [Mycena sanguinolenta]